MDGNTTDNNVGYFDQVNLNAEFTIGTAASSELKAVRGSLGHGY